MGTSRYECQTKRILVEAEGRSKGWKKRALKRLNRELDLFPVHSGGRVVGMRQRGTGKMNCTKQTFASEDAAQDALFQIGLMPGENKKPDHPYECPHCGHWHLTSQRISVSNTTAAVSVDADDGE